jgi:hypothetical protein
VPALKMTSGRRMTVKLTSSRATEVRSNFEMQNLYVVGCPISNMDYDIPQHFPVLGEKKPDS